MLLTMIFLHIVDDYYLQGWLASAKQKKWWLENSPNKLYRYDYLWALFMHSFSWTFMVTLPITIKCSSCIRFYILILLNIIIHGFVDNLKANKLKINLIQDQLIHLLQIVITFLLLV